MYLSPEFLDSWSSCRENELQSDVIMIVARLSPGAQEACVSIGWADDAGNKVPVRQLAGEAAQIFVV